jgi:hypothetical protein
MSKICKNHIQINQKSTKKEYVGVIDFVPDIYSSSKAEKSSNLSKINDRSCNTILALKADVSQNKADISGNTDAIQD